MDWQPIETAPTDTKSFLGWLYLPRNPRASCAVIAQRAYDQDEGDWWINGRYYGGKAFNEKTDGVFVATLTHWMPLPAPPQTDSREG